MAITSFMDSERFSGGEARGARSGALRWGDGGGVDCGGHPTRERSVDAAELVEVDYEPLAVVTDAVEAATNEVLLFEDAGTNVCIERPPSSTDEELFAGCEATVSGTI